MYDLNPRIRPRQLVGVFAVTALFLALLMASAIAGSASTSGFTAEDERRTGPLVIEPTDSLRKVQVPVIVTEVATVDVCTGEGLVGGKAIDSAASMQELIDTYCYPVARLAQETADDSYPQGRIAGQVDMTCAGEGLVGGKGIDSAASMQELLDTYCYPVAQLADVAVDDSYPQGRISGRVDE